MSDALNQYKSALTPQQVDAALTKLTETDVGDFVTRADLLQLVYPVGSIYISASNVSPQTFLGGTWQQIQGRFLLAADDAYTAGSTGGEATHTLTQAELPSYALPVTNGNNIVFSRNGASEGAFAETSATGWGLPNWTAVNISVQSGGGNQPHNNMPPYLAVYMWRRTA